MLRLLAATPGETVPRQALAGNGGAIGERAVDVQVNRLRRKIEHDPGQSAAGADRARHRIPAGDDAMTTLDVGIAALRSAAGRLTVLRRQVAAGLTALRSAAGRLPDPRRPAAAGLTALRTAADRLPALRGPAATGLAALRSAGSRFYDLYDRASITLKGVMPKGLYARALLIIIAPMVVLQSVVAFMFMERHYNLVTQRLSAGVVQDIATLIEVYKVYPQDADHAQLRRIAQEKLGLVVDFLPVNELPPPGPKPFFSLVDQALSEEVRKQIGRPFWIDTVGRSALVEIRIKLDNAVMRVFAPRSAAYVSNSHIFLAWMVGTSLVLITVAVLFLRNQIRPILRLADAAESFGKGREVPDFRPRGAREVRRAAQAFIEMKSRIERAMEQRTAMLAGVSHDLRTILTRFKLELALIGDSPEVEAMKKDVDEMGRDAGGLSRLRARGFGRAVGADRHGRLPRGAQDRCRAQRPQVERAFPRPSDRHRAAGGVQALPRQSGLERGAPCAFDLDHRPPRPPLAHRHRGRRRSRHRPASARGSVQAVPAARRRAQPGRRRHRSRARHRARHRPLARRRHQVVG